METLLVPTAYPTDAECRNIAVLQVNVWGDNCEAIEVLGAVGSEWFSRYLSKVSGGVRFVRMKDDCVRRTDSTYAPLGQNSFSDGFPFLLASESSIADVNVQLGNSAAAAADKDNKLITLERFRPNIVVSGAAPFAEDTWERIRFHGVTNSSASSSRYNSFLCN